MKTAPLSPALGVEVTGIDVRSLDDATFDQLRDLFHEHSVMVIRDQDLTPDDHIAFAKRWGEININRFFKPTDTHPEIATVLKEPDQRDNIGEAWHTDHSYDQVPAMGSILYAIETPPTGGDTMFCSMHAAFDGLDNDRREMFLGMNARHSSRLSFGYNQADNEAYKDGWLGNMDAAVQDALHPVVIAHPDTGRPALYTNNEFTLGFEGWSDEDSKSLLDEIEAHSTQDAYCCRVQWRPGTITMWDNRAVMHRAMNDYHGHRRLMHRITVEGCPLEAYASVSSRA